MTNGLNLLCASDSDWAADLQGAGTVATLDIPVLHSALHGQLGEKLDQLRESANIDSHLDWVPAGSGAPGQTRVLSFLRRESLARQFHFVLVDMTDMHDFWPTVQRGFLHSLQQNQADGTTRCTALLEDLLGVPGPLESLQGAMASLRTAEPAKLAKLTAVFINMLARCHATATTCHQDVLRALIGLNSDHRVAARVGMSWLRGHTIEESDRRTFGFAQAQRSAREIVEGLSWWMSLVAPTVLVFDPPDPVVTQLQLTVNRSEEGAADVAAHDEMESTKSIIEEIGCGLAALRHVTRRTLTLVFCRQATWQTLLHRIERASSPCPVVS